jgi:hypothetical protein
MITNFVIHDGVLRPGLPGGGRLFSSSRPRREIFRATRLGSFVAGR